MSPCVPPQSLAIWSAVLLSGAIALGVEAIALLLTLRPVTGGSWGWLALRGLLSAGALAVAIQSLAVRISADAIYQRYVALFGWDPYTCLGGAHYSTPATHAAFMRHVQQVIAPTEHAAAIASGAAAILLIIGAYLLARWARQRRRAAPQSAVGMSSDDWQRERIV
ncbi:MAG TPA: hypothetical protein VFQ25_05990 [Ktedonobacterales bacterium]|nr:hypothetical protein [Ktedonobacterales bacterium]